MSYQPIKRDGKFVGGERASDDRYGMIRPVLDLLPPGFTVLDIGANRGYFSLRIAEDFPDTRIMAADRIPEIKEIASDRIAVASTTLRPADIRNLPRVDVILSLSVLHHFPDWRGALDAMRQCREWLIIEVPHPDETWMRSAASRGSVREIHQEVERLSVELIGISPRSSRDGKQRFMRPLYLIPGTVRRTEGTAFGGSGSNSKKMPPFSNGLEKLTGYTLTPGSLNLRTPRELTWGDPTIDWVGKKGSKTRDYQLWNAWIESHRCHAMVPGKRGHGDNCMEMVSAYRLRDRFSIRDGDKVAVDFEPTREIQTITEGSNHYSMWRYPGKIAKCMEQGFPYEKSLLRYMKKRKFRGLAVDAGANLGNHTLWMAAVCGMRVAAFEPIKHAELTENVRINRHLRDRVDVYPVALGDSPTPVKHVGKGRLVPGGALEVRTLDSYVLTGVRVIKADVEGMEPHTLRGGEKTIRRDKPVIFAECWNEDAKRVIDDILSPWGYRHIHDFRHGKGGTVVGMWETGR